MRRVLFFWPRIGHLEFADHRLLGSRFGSRCRLILFDDSMTRNLHDAIHVIKRQATFLLIEFKT